jgi:hypothetical protein
MRRPWSAIVLVLGLSGSAVAQDGGTLPWRGKNEDPKAAMADAKRAGQPMMLFFSSVG